MTVGQWAYIPLYRNRKGNGYDTYKKGPGVGGATVNGRLRKCKLNINDLKKKGKNYGQVFDLFGSRT